MIASSAGLMELHGWQTVAPAYKVPLPYTFTSSWMHYCKVNNLLTPMVVFHAGRKERN